MTPETLGGILLALALPRVQGAGFIPDTVARPELADVHAGRDYPFHKKAAIDQLVGRTWNMLEREGFIEPTPGMNGQYGWRQFTDKGRRVAEGENLQKVREAGDLPLSLLHPTIRERGWTAIVHSANSLDTTSLASAVRDAFVIVEDAVRVAAGCKPSDFGDQLIEKAFHPDTGVMGDRDATKPKKEREGLMVLFKGAMNAFRNPTSHRNLDIGLEEAKDQLLLASHLLRIIDQRKPR
ncbi:TIGR02391 family protein [Bradyrhizobium sp. LB13.1]